MDDGVDEVESDVEPQDDYNGLSDSDESDFAQDVADASEDIGDIGDDDEEDIEETSPSSGGDQEHGYKAATDCHELVRRLREKQKEDPRWVVEVEKEPGTNRLTHLFWMTPSQVEAASRFNYLVIHDNTYNGNMFFHLGCFTTINEHGKSLLVGQALRERDCDYE